MASNKDITKRLADNLGLQFDSKRIVAFGTYEGYTILVRGMSGSNTKNISVSCSASLGGRPVDIAALESFKHVKYHLSDNYTFEMTFAITGAAGKFIDNVTNITNSILGTLNTNGYENCDIEGSIGDTDVYLCSEKYVFLNNTSANEIFNQLQAEESEYAIKRENIPFGAIGAVIGSVAGLIATLLLARLGIVSMISGAVTGLASVYLYKKFAGKFSVLGGIICAVIDIAMTYVAFRTDATIDLYNALKEDYPDISFFDLFRTVKEFYELAGAMDTYNHNFVLIMLFGVILIIGVIAGMLSREKHRFELIKLGL